MTSPGPIAIAACDVARRLDELAAVVSSRHPDGVLLLPVLPEASLLAADLADRLTVPVEREGMHVTPFGAGGSRAKLIRTGNTPLADRHVIVLTAIVDTGLRLRFCVQSLQTCSPASLTVFTLLDRPDRRIAEIPLEHVGFTVPDCLFAGYGLGRDPELMALRDVHYRDLASAERARRGHLVIA